MIRKFDIYRPRPLFYWINNRPILIKAEPRIITEYNLPSRKRWLKSYINKLNKNI